MVKTIGQKKQTTKAARTELRQKLVHRKNWYPISDTKSHFTRKSKTPRAYKNTRSLVPGQVLILLSGRFRGRRVVYLKTLPSNLLLVSGPYKLNGVPLKRVNPAYVISTQTKVNVGNLSVVSAIDDKFFENRVEIKRTSFFENAADKKARITDERKKAQAAVDSELVNSIKTVEHLKEYLQNRFSLSNVDRPHTLKF